MPFKLSTTIGKIQNLPNSKNIEIVNDFLEYMRSNGSSEHHQNNNLKVVITFSNFIGKDNSFYIYSMIIFLMVFLQHFL
jgi:integrase/recombinase XerD